MFVPVKTFPWPNIAEVQPTVRNQRNYYEQSLILRQVEGGGGKKSVEGRGDCTKGAERCGISCVFLNLFYLLNVGKKNYCSLLTDPPKHFFITEIMIYSEK